MKKGLGILLFGIALLVFATASAVEDLHAGTNVFTYLFIIFSILGLIVSVVGLVVIFLEDWEIKANKTMQSINSEKEDKE